MNPDLGDALVDVDGLALWVAGVLIAVIGAARLTRLVVHDEWPPTTWIRQRWLYLTSDEHGDPGPWSKLATCHWCFGPWAFALALGTAWLTHLHWGWWLFWGWLAGSYLVSIFVENDEKD